MATFSLVFDVLAAVITVVLLTTLVAKYLVMVLKSGGDSIAANTAILGTFEKRSLLRQQVARR